MSVKREGGLFRLYFRKNRGQLSDSAQTQNQYNDLGMDQGISAPIEYDPTVQKLPFADLVQMMPCMTEIKKKLEQKRALNQQKVPPRQQSQRGKRRKSQSSSTFSQSNVLTGLEDDEIDIELNRIQQEILEDARFNPVLQSQRIREAKQASEPLNSLSHYERMLKGDKVLLTHEDELIEINKNFLFDEVWEDDSEDDSISDDKVEQASDDEEITMNNKKKKKNRDEDVKEEDFEGMSSDDDVNMDDLENESLSADKNARKLNKSKKTRNNAQDADLGDENEDPDTIFIDNLPSDEFEIRRQLQDVKRYIKQFEIRFFEEEDSEKEEELKKITDIGKHEEALQVFKDFCHLKHFWCMPLSSDVRNIDFEMLIAQQRLNSGGSLFDVITCDPPWQLSSANPTRGVAIAYDTLTDGEILNIPWARLQDSGFIFIWVINAKLRFALQLMEECGYRLIDEIAWVKQTCNGKIARGHGYYLQHAKETCLVGVKGNMRGRCKFNLESDVIFSERRGQSQKPEEIYEIVEALVPNGYYLEIFGRRNNLHDGWVTLGNEL
ncbi:mt-a70 family protein [Stylonychia lemnae]|uniref:mRNA m(6)A methyltransferase n=1 Tax=Stylonychia lemnae TaxID=5949 RepID=A0A078AHT3_STYLE|nr:mt-a70 family protein [Stylonychia lemnae]|eukprot:CDW81830.1 mt-a70 family protein [Stylonychia lemnae]